MGILLYLNPLRNGARIKCTAFYSHCLSNKEIICPKVHVISAQSLTLKGGFYVRKGLPF
jgi:hypothetical protein